MRTGKRRSAEKIMLLALPGILSSLFVPIRMARVRSVCPRVDMQRDKLASQLGELEATERVLARYSKSTQVKKTASAGRPTTAKKVAAPARRHEPTTTAKAAGRKRSASNLGDQILALATGKTQQEIAAACKRREKEGDVDGRRTAARVWSAGPQARHDRQRGRCRSVDFPSLCRTRLCPLVKGGARSARDQK